jgi:hypothetical protein
MQGGRFRPFIARLSLSFRLRFWRIEGSNAAPYYFGLKGIDLSPSLCNYGLKIGSYAPISYYTKVLKDSGSASKLPWANRL